ncbi:MAG: DEAD/DEAH box helicase, partial [Phycisphaerae bacterium]
APTPTGLSPAVSAMLAGRGIDRLYTHQAEALAAVRAGEDVVVATGTASGKSLCYQVPIVETLAADPESRFLLTFPTKALCQDQFAGFRRSLDAAGLDDVLAGVYDSDTAGPLRRKLRDEGRVIFTNPDMLHAAIMPQHARWAKFLQDLRLVVVDEIHVCTGIFGSNVANLMRRFARVCEHYGSDPRYVCCSATIANPRELAQGLLGRPIALVDRDGSPRGRRTYVLWNPPRLRETTWKSRRSANVEAHELMARLICHGAGTITFSKSKMSSEMIARYVGETLQREAPHLARRVAPYRGGYLPCERRQIEKQLFEGELKGVSTTRALELGIDVGSLDAAVLVGYPGTLASFFQQSGRAGRRDTDALVFLVGLDTAVNQYIMSAPDYLFERAIEQGVIDPGNPFVLTGHLRCAAHELPLTDGEVEAFGPRAPLVLEVLEGNRKVRRLEGQWYHAAGETPQHEVGLRDTAGANTLIVEEQTARVLGEVNRFDAPPILHPGAIYIHQGDTHRVLELDMERNIATVRREEVDYYTNPLGGTDIHHIDHQLREKPFGNGRAAWGEVTAYFNTNMYERIHFYSLDVVSLHPVDLPTQSLDTMAFWLVGPEELMEQVRRDGLDAHGGLRGIGYATRQMLPLFMTCDTLDFSHTVGSINSPWNAVFIYERFPLGLGFTETAYHDLHRIMPAVLEMIERCPCEEGCPCCVGKPLRQYATWNVELYEASIPSKAAAVRILRGLLGDGSNLQAPDTGALTDETDAEQHRLRRALQRRLERGREPKLMHAIAPQAKTEYPVPEDPAALEVPDVARRKGRRRDFHKDLRKRINRKLGLDGLDPATAVPPPPEGMRKGHVRTPRSFQGRPGTREDNVSAAPDESASTRGSEETQTPPPSKKPGTISLGDSLAARARRRRKKE